mgnify:CR=1
MKEEIDSVMVTGLFFDSSFIIGRSMFIFEVSYQQEKTKNQERSTKNPLSLLTVNREL